MTSFDARGGRFKPAAKPADDDPELLIARARSGCPEALGRLADRCRQYLLWIANRELDVELRSKVGASDLVQETLLQAQQIIGRFDGTSEHQLRSWLRQILLHRAAHATRSYRGTGKRDIRLEQPSDPVAGHSAWDELADGGPSPERGAVVAERAAAIERALENLPAIYRDVIVMRCFERQSFVQIGKKLEMSADAARKAWCRGIDRLRREWKPDDGSR